MVLATALVTSDVPPVHASVTQYGYFKAAYPSSPLSGFANTVPSNGCLICHPTTGGPASPAQFFNAYGSAYAAVPHGSQAAAIAALHSIDSANSDNDGPTITVNKSGTGSGTVTSSPGGLTCGATCTASFAGVSGAVTLTATPAAGSTFAGWSGGGTPDCSGTGTCAVRSDNRTEIDLGTFPSDSGSRPTINVTASFTGQPFDYSLGNAGAINVTQGQSGATSINASLVAGTSQSVSFAASGLPSGATAGFSSGACTPTCTSQLTITTTGATPPGTFPITVTSSPLSRTTTLNLVVNAPAPPPFNYALTNSGGITVAPGASGTTTITATLVAGATQSVSFVASGLPGGATAGFSPGACTPTCTSQLTITTTAATPPGTFPITVTGTPLSRTTTLNLVVNPPTPPPFNYALANSGAITVAPGASGATTITASLVAGATQSVSFVVSALPSGATAGFSPGACTPTCTSQLTITTTGATPPGTFPITVTGSPLSRTTSLSLTVGAVPPGADLVVTGLTAPTAGTIGGMIDDILVTVKNQGSAVAGSHRVGLYYSIDSSITTGNVLGGFCTIDQPLNPGESRSCGGLIGVPGSLSPGTYHLGAFVDDLGQVLEANEQNNARTADTGSITLIGAGTSPLMLSLNETVYAAGDLLNLTMLTQPGAPSTAADFYLVLLIPGGSGYIFDGANWALIYDGTNIFPGAIKPFRAGAPVMNISEIVLGAEVPDAIPHGTYTFLVVLVRAGADPLNTANWLVPPAEAAFSF